MMERKASKEKVRVELTESLLTWAPVRRHPRPYNVRPIRGIISIGANEPSLNTYMYNVYIKNSRNCTCL